MKQTLREANGLHAPQKSMVKSYKACWFHDLKVKDFQSTCSMSIPGEPQKTKHHDLVPCPQVAVDYLKNAASIDIHNCYRTGSCGMKDA